MHAVRRSPTHARSAEKPYACTQCGEALRMHAVRRSPTHARSAEKPYACTQCGEALRMHAVRRSPTHARSAEKPYPCKAFRWKSNFNSHKNHMAEKIYPVPEEHVRIHIVKKPVECRQCRKTFRNQSILKTHMNSHAGDKL
nr:zinc finger protein 317-like [Pongo abelii]